jgi:amino acid transporter
MAQNNTASAKFGTFGGVFVPNILTILGIILFLRCGWVVGQAGLTHALLMVALGSLITLLTSLSLSAVATNIKVKAGGAYYLISRSLGLEIGGGIGIPLYLSQAVSVAFYLIGFAEAFCGSYQQFDPTWVAFIVCTLFAIIALIGADIAVKLQYFIFVILGMALVSFFYGGMSLESATLWSSGYTKNQNFWTVFAIFFPAVTGIMSGVSMSGDLKDPQKSIPSGTILAVVISWVLYSLAMIWFAGNASRSVLLQDMFVMKDISKWGFLFNAGVWAATLSSGLACMVGAPRTLQALSIDKVSPSFFARKLGSPTEPRAGVLLTYVISILVILQGDLDLVAPIITMFFLNTYGMLNLVAGIEQITGNPSYRPRLKVSGLWSMIGALGCYGVMLLIHAPATIVAIVISYTIYFYLKKRALRQYWGDSRSGLWFSLARHVLNRLEKFELSPKNWKPNLAVFSGNPIERPELIELARWLSKGNGNISVFQLIIGEITDESLIARAKMAKKGLAAYFDEKKIIAFPESMIVENLGIGTSSVMQAYGIGKFKPNVFVFGMPGDENILKDMANAIISAQKLDKSVLLLNLNDDDGFGEYSSIDIWWGDSGENNELMLMLAHLISSTSEWNQSRIRVLSMIDNPQGIEQAELGFKDFINKLNYDVEVKIVVNSRDLSITNMMANYSSTTDLTIVELGALTLGSESQFASNTFSLGNSLGTSLFVHSSKLDSTVSEE